MGRPSYPPPPKKQRFVYSWQGKVDAITCQGGKVTDQPSFSPPRQPSFCTRLILTLVRVGKEWASPVFPHPIKSNGCLHIHDKVRLILSLVGWGKNGPAQFFSTQITSFCTRLILSVVSVGKEWAGPVFPHPIKRKGCLHIHDTV